MPPCLLVLPKPSEDLRRNRLDRTAAPFVVLVGPAELIEHLRVGRAELDQDDALGVDASDLVAAHERSSGRTWAFTISSSRP